VNEYTVEAGRPDTFSAEKLQILKKHGVRRISVNPQTTNDTVLKNIGRRHTAEDFFSAVKLSRENGFDNINADIIAGLPGDNFESFVKSIDDLLKFDPESITLHTLTYKRSSDLFKGDKGSETFSAAEQVDYAERKLPQMGLNPYYLYRQKNTVGNLENVGYAKPEFESLYNIYIMEENQNILACGAGASTKLVNPKTGLINRIFNFKYPYEYIARFDEVISRKEKILEFFRAESMKEQI
ncbi:MAG: coproporphyrinogen dehydrogenase HemZ, partial [Ruminococcus sp.]|nr:coproporphyrinogen dehydrogenase HemZ [Ruminococcus sp.]